MDFIKKFFVYLDGKKTNIGTALLIISAFSEQVLIGMWGVSIEWLPKVVLTLDWLGMVTGVTGLSHKGVKLIKGKDETTG